MIPSFFIAHGAPSLALEQNDYTHFVANLLQTIKRPKAIILFSAHWENRIQKVSYVEKYPTIHDFYGFPQELYDINYPAKGSTQWAQRVEKLLKDKGIPTESDYERGLDHGAWVVLRLLRQEADIPVISMSVNSKLTPLEQYNIGKALAGLRDEDVLIIGSGGTVHNLRAVNFSSAPGQVDPWALEFDQWLENELSNWNIETLFQYRETAPHVEFAVPSYGTEHFVPLFYAMGAADHHPSAQLLFRSFTYGNLSHSVWQFG
jgi:4,5-DOPA dioxygenase extradiol